MRRVRRLRTSRAPSRSCIAGIRQVTRISQTTPLSRAVPPNFVVAVRQLGKEEADATRTQIVHYLLRRVVTDLKARLDPASFLNCGWNELEAFVDALLGGGIHHLRAALPARGAYPAPFAAATRLDDGGYYAPEPSVVLYLL
jgi:hypothetical protein